MAKKKKDSESFEFEVGGAAAEEDAAPEHKSFSETVKDLAHDVAEKISGHAHEQKTEASQGDQPLAGHAKFAKFKTEGK